MAITFLSVGVYHDSSGNLLHFRLVTLSMVFRPTITSVPQYLTADLPNDVTLYVIVQQSKAMNLEPDIVQLKLLDHLSLG